MKLSLQHKFAIIGIVIFFIISFMIIARIIGNPFYSYMLASLYILIPVFIAILVLSFVKEKLHKKLTFGGIFSATYGIILVPLAFLFLKVTEASKAMASEGASGFGSMKLSYIDLSIYYYPMGIIGIILLTTGICLILVGIYLRSNEKKIDEYEDSMSRKNKKLSRRASTNRR